MPDKKPACVKDFPNRLTKAELVKLLNENFKDDEEVNFLYHDDGKDIFGTVKSIKKHMKAHIHRHFEYLKDGKWVRWSKWNADSEYRMTDWWRKLNLLDHDNVVGWWREVTDSECYDTRKVLEIV